MPCAGIVSVQYLYGRLFGPKSLKPSRHILKVLGFEVSSALEILSVLGHSLWFCCVSSVHKMRTFTSLLSIYSETSWGQAFLLLYEYTMLCIMEFNLRFFKVPLLNNND